MPQASLVTSAAINRPKNFICVQVVICYKRKVTYYIYDERKQKSLAKGNFLKGGVKLFFKRLESKRLKKPDNC